MRCRALPSDAREESVRARSSGLSPATISVCIVPAVLDVQTARSLTVIA